MKAYDALRALEHPPWTITRHAQVLVVEVTAQRLFDPMLVDALDQALRQELTGSDDVVLELSSVRFISSAMLGRLVMHWQARQDLGRDLLLAGVQGTLAEIMHIAGLDRRLRLHPDRASALASLAGRAP